jgi:two-component system, OmpR family, response regulator
MTISRSLALPDRRIGALPAFSTLADERPVRTPGITKALIVDDDEDILALCKISLRAFAGWSVWVARSKDAVLRAVREHEPDVILLDVMMPGLDGIHLLEELKADVETSRIPVVLLTASSPEFAEVRKRGAAGVISKPFEPSTLSIQVERLLERAS